MQIKTAKITQKSLTGRVKVIIEDSGSNPIESGWLPCIKTVYGIPPIGALVQAVFGVDFSEGVCLGQFYSCEPNIVMQEDLSIKTNVNIDGNLKTKGSISTDSNVTAKGNIRGSKVTEG